MSGSKPGGGGHRASVGECDAGAADIASAPAHTRMVNASVRSGWGNVPDSTAEPWAGVVETCELAWRWERSDGEQDKS